MDATVMTCPHCGHQTHGFVRICPMCGGEIVKAALQKASTCPRCGGPLEDSDCHNHHLVKCSRCSGLWIPERDFEVLTSERDVYRDDNVPTACVRNPPPTADGYLPCPCCGSRMNRLNFKRISGVVIDRCRDCGWWLDAGELESIRAFIAAGGIEKAQDKQILQQHDELRELARSVDHLEFMQKVIHRWNFKRWLFDGF